MILLALQNKEPFNWVLDKKREEELDMCFRLLCFVFAPYANQATLDKHHFKYERHKNILLTQLGYLVFLGLEA